MKRKSFVFYISWRDILADYPAKVRHEVFDAIIEYANSGEIPEMGELASMAFKFIRREMDENAQRFENTIEARRAAGKKGGAPKGNQNASKFSETEETSKTSKTSKNKQKQTKQTKQAEDEDEDEDEDIESTGVASSKERKLTLPKESAEEEDAERISYQAIANQWNDILGDKLPKVISVNEKRQPKVKLRLQELQAKNITPEDLFQRIAASTFLTGGGPRKWKATFDWVFDNPNNWVKVMEGTYDNEVQNDTQASQQQAGANGKKLGPGEFYDKGGRRTYGTGKYTVPDDAPPRPSEQYYWNPSTLQWLVG